MRTFQPQHLKKSAPLLLGALILAVAALVGLQAQAGAKASAKRHRAAKRHIGALRVRHAAPASRHARRVASRRHDSDRDGLSNWIEVRRTKTNWRHADTDGDGLLDGIEVRVTKTNPRKADTDGDGVSDGVEVHAGSDPRNPASVPTSPPPSEPPPSGPPPTENPPPSEGPPSEPPPTENPPPSEGPKEQPPCVDGAVSATSASAVTGAVAAKRSVCVKADVGNLTISNQGDRAGVVISTDGGSIGHVEISNTQGLTLRSARLRSVTIRSSSRTVVESSIIGGTPTNRVMDQLVFMPDESDGVVIRNNDIGWTKADDSGNTGYGCRCYGKTDGLRFVGNVVHDIAADGFQGTNGSDVLVDRNKIGPVGANPGSSEHSDNIQIVGNGPNLRITNNWIYEQGYFDGGVTNNAGSTYIHGGTSNSLLYENNLIQIARGRTEICGLGTGGTSRSNITIRRNTWVEGGQAFSGFPGFEWDCDSGTGNRVERNIAVDPDGGFAQDGSASAATFSANLWGKPSLVTLDAQGNCTSANCNPAGQEPIGYRKPSGVRW